MVTALAIVDAVLAPAPAANQPDFVDTILASRAVVAATRIAIVFTAIFVVLSVVALIVRRQWLTRVGPVEVTDQSSHLEAQIRMYEEELEAAYRVIDVLEGVVASTHQLVDRERRR